MSSSGDVRIGDLERERAVNDLGDHFAAGRLTRDELDDRLDRAWAATSAADLRPLFADLPAGAVVASPPAPRGVSASWANRPRRGFPLPLLVVLAIVLTIVTHVPFIMVFVAWFVLSRVVAGRHHRPYAIRP